jgi:hypothetical protein
MSGAFRLSNKQATMDRCQATRSAANIVKILKDRMRSDFITPVIDLPRWALKGAKAETGVVVLNDAMISEF